ncbi:MAG TPA: ribbon-helix-helix domain-containing protein [Verrucomicrobiales bacterium]|nr:ribbon-helix-helix domain-containing protein [Verrucomicrobiales bacterium]
MTITLPSEEAGILSRLVAAGRYATREAALAEAVRRLENEDNESVFVTEPLSAAEADEVYSVDEPWESVERAIAGQARPEA